MTDNYQNLKNAIILQAVKDYRDAETPKTKSAIIRFIRSDWFKALTDLEPEMLIKKLQEEECSDDH